MDINPTLYFCGSNRKWHLYEWAVFVLTESGDDTFESGSISGPQSTLDAECYSVFRAVLLAERKSSIIIFSEAFLEESKQIPVVNESGLSFIGLNYLENLQYKILKKELSVDFRKLDQGKNPIRKHLGRKE